MLTLPNHNPTSERTAHRIVLAGRVQGIGLRPMVARLAREAGLGGSVGNTSQGVEILVEGCATRLLRFEKSLREQLPDAAVIVLIDEAELPATPRQEFTIRAAASASTAATGISATGISAIVPNDLAVCDACLAETRSTPDRRAGYPFTSCTVCGPRYSIIATMPYERRDTTLRAFELCPECAREYADLSSRRCHAQTNGCPHCGPQVWTADREGRRIGERTDAIRQCVAALQAGQIVAMKGLGGYQLLVDARNVSAVARLRARKQRPDKPLAVLVDSLAAAERLAHFTKDEQDIFLSPTGPIVLVAARPDNGLAENLHPGVDRLGLMRPTTPLHWIAASECGPLVATSGNRDGEPLAYDEQTAEEQLGAIADFFLHHNRPIRRPIDDSVVQVIAGVPTTIRAARGIAPLPLGISSDTNLRLANESSGNCSILALGGHQKTAVALWNGSQAILGPHVGDLDTIAARQRYQEHIRELCQLYDAEPDLLVHDLHPDYYTTRFAWESGKPTFAVQHHHAHVVAGIVEAGLWEQDVLGVAWDGTGFGPDGTIWGGEFLLSTCAAYRRIASLRPFALPGGEAAIREPWRIAVSLVHAALGSDAASRLTFSNGLPMPQAPQIVGIIERSQWSPITTSAGRLFDGIAAVVLPPETTHGGRASYEGHLSMLLEAACDESASGSYSLPLVSAEPARLDWRPMISAILTDRAAGVSPGVIAMRFHRALAQGVRDALAAFPDTPAVLTGGVFQNRRLVELVMETTSRRRARVHPPGLIPVNDGGLAAGQLAAARAAWRGSHFQSAKGAKSACV